MKTKITLALAGSRIGRIALHTFCAIGDRKFAWHYAGIVREVVAML